MNAENDEKLLNGTAYVWPEVRDDVCCSSVNRCEVVLEHINMLRRVNLRVQQPMLRRKAQTLAQQIVRSS